MNLIEANTMLETCYKKAIDGIPLVSKPIDDFATEYLTKSSSKSEAAKKLIKYQIAKCGTSGFVTNLGGLITLPVAIPANISSVLYVQLRMVAAIAYMGGYDVTSDQVQTLAFVCVTGNTAGEILKKSGINFSEKFAKNFVQKKITGEMLQKINKLVGFRFITKAGEKGVVNLTKCLPVVGGIVGGGFDIATTKIIANNAYKLFILNKNID